MAVGGPGRSWPVDDLDDRKGGSAQKLWGQAQTGQAVAESGVLYFGPGDVLIRTRSANEWTGSDFTRPTDRPVREIDFLGRHCWEVELAPPSYKPAPIQLVVDVATGTVLEPGRCFPRSPDATANW